MRLVEAPLAEEGLIGGHDGNVVRVGQAQQVGLGLDLVRQVVALQFDIEAIGEDVLQAKQRPFGGIELAVDDLPVDDSIAATGEQDQAAGVLRQRLPRHVRLVADLHLEMGLARQLHEVGVAFLGLHQHGHGPELELRGDRPCPALGLEGKVELTANDHLHAGLDDRVRQVPEAEQIVGVGHADSRHAEFPAKGGDLVGLQRSLEQREG